MEKITIDEQNKKRIQKYIKQSLTMYGYEKDIALLETKGQLTEELARKVFSMIMNKAQMIREILTPEENDEFLEEMTEIYSKYDKIPKPEQLEKYGFYDGAYKNIELEDVYKNMQTAFEVLELDTKYYECKDLRDIASTVINSIDGIAKYKIELQPEVKTELQGIQEELRNLLAQDKTDIKAIQDRVDKYNAHAMDIWNDYLTSVDDTKSSEYRWVVHNLTKGELQGDFRDKYMSTSIITNNTMGLYGRANYGLIIKPKHIVSASYKDSYTLNTRENEENLFNIRRPPLMLPQEIEEICMQQTIEANGELLNYEKAPIYPEIVVDDYEIEGMYYISNGEHELARNYDRARKMAEERGLPLIERDISRYRAEHGLEPMTEIAKRSLCGDILQKCCDGDKELQEVYNKYYHDFVDTHFQEFYEQYMKLKEQGDYSKDDILQVFAELARDDIHFNKIPQSVEEMYLTDEEKEERRLEREYGINNISDRENLQHKLEKIVSDGIQYSAYKDNPDAEEQFEEIKTVIPQFEEFKEFYLQLRVAGIEDELYEGIDYKTISYAELLERAKAIVKEHEKIKQQSEIKQDKKEQTEVANTDVKTTEETEQDNSIGAEINEFGEIIRHRNVEIPREIETVKEVTLAKKSNEGEKTKKEKISPMKEFVRDEVKNTEQQMQVADPQATDLWVKRFSSWYSVLDRVNQKAKTEFLKMKSDIIKAIREKIKERSNQHEFNKNQDQNER